MRRKIVPASLILTVVSVLLTGCSPPLAKSQLKFGIRAAQNDLWDEAIFRWKRTLETTPGSAAAHNNLAVAYEKKGRLQDAANEYELALKLSPDNRYIQSNYEKLKSLLKDQEEKAEEAKKSDEKK